MERKEVFIMAQAIGSIITFIIVSGIPYLKKNIENQKEIEQKIVIWFSNWIKFDIILKEDI